MKLSTAWLKDYVDSDLSIEKLVEKLNVTGTEVDSVSFGLDENVVVAKIKKVEKHPDADRLRIATVFDGENDLNIVCGAPNIYEGMVAPLAKIGTVLSGGEIKRTKIRGVESEGMLCAEDELGLGEDHSGIIDLPKDYTIGKSLASYISKEAVLELEITPNRGDCLSHIGVAREIAAFSNKQITKKPISLNMSGANVKDTLEVEIEDKKLCPQYMARVIDGVKIAPSPKWLQERLLSIGQKPINNIVDVTNYIMYDLGQPLHAFDAAKIEGKKIIVRKSKKAEKIETLDGIERQLNDAIVISDPKKAVAIAGIMGGKNSEVTESTTKIILESAEFERKSIRKTKKELGLLTDASYRFERGIDSGSVEYALNKATSLINEIAGGNILSGIAQDGTRPQNQTLKIEYAKINKLVGLSLDDAEINRLLKSLGFEIKGDECIIPLWRHDIEVWQDLAEEVARLYGYDKITHLPVTESKLPKKSEYYYREKLKDILADDGLNEVINYPYLSEADVNSFKLSKSLLVEIANPIQPEYKYLRNSLYSGLLKSVAKNPSFDQVFLFEFGKVFTSKKESTHLGLIAAGKNADQMIEKAITDLINVIDIKKNNYEKIVVEKQILDSFKIRKAVVQYFEIDLEMVNFKLKEKDLNFSKSSKNIVYRPVSKFPAVTRDLAFIVDSKVKSDALIETIYGLSEQINRVELFDEFASDKFGKGKKNIAYHIYLQNLEKTMTDKEADEIINQIIKSIEKNYGAKLRS